MTIMMVGGVFDDNGGRRSGLIEKLANELRAFGCQVSVFNGGHYNELSEHLEAAHYYDCLFWFADVPNDKPKINNLKFFAPHVMLVTSKRNDGQYSFQDLVSRALNSRSNLLMEFRKQHVVNPRQSTKHECRVVDPLGTVWCDYTDNLPRVARRTVERLRFLVSCTRQSSNRAGDVISVPDESEFFDIVRNLGERFHELIAPADGVTRFLGNASFRCQGGFPSFRAGQYIFVSRRNIDKRTIGPEGFVATQLIDNMIWYWGDKPSVDTPIQLQLYRMFPNINYMVHSHTYIENAPFTKIPIPCGALEEVNEISSMITDPSVNRQAINLLGHGSLIMADKPNINLFKHISRPAPEIINF